MPVETAVRFILEASEALAEAHAAGIVHRDLKPANLFLTTRADGSGRIKVLDFGISKIAVEPGSQMDNLTKTAALMGSPMYMAPEQMRSAKTADLRADIWAMGAILFELLTAHPPFAGSTLPQVCSRILTWPPEPLGELAPHVPEAVVAAVLRCLEKDPQARFQSLAELAEAIAPYGGGAAGRSAELIRRVTPEPTRAAMPQNPAAVLAATPAGAGPPYGPVAATPTKGSSRLVIALVTGVLLLAAIAMVLVLKLARKRDPGPNPDISTASSSGGQHGAAASAVPGQTAQLESPAPEAGVATAGSSSSSRDVPVLPPVAPRKPSVVAPPVRPPPPAKRPGDELFTTRAP